MSRYKEKCHTIFQAKAVYSKIVFLRPSLSLDYMK